LEADLDRDAAAHAVADEVRALDAERVHRADDRVREVARAVGRRGGLGGAAEAGKVDRVDRVAAAERRGGVEEARLGRAETVQQQHVRAFAHRQRADPQAPDRDLVDAQERRAAGGEPEEALEADGQVEVAARVQAALGERLDAGDLALAQLQPGLGVGADHDVGLALAPAGPHAGADRGAADLPAAADVAQPDVVGGVEARLRPEIPGRQRAERLGHARRKVGHRANPTRRRGGYAHVRARRHPVRHSNPLTAAVFPA
jgi:hypothetical protein